MSAHLFQRANFGAKWRSRPTLSLTFEPQWVPHLSRAASVQLHQVAMSITRVVRQRLISTWQQESMQNVDFHHYYYHYYFVNIPSASLLIVSIIKDIILHFIYQCRRGYSVTNGFMIPTPAHLSQHRLYIYQEWY